MGTNAAVIFTPGTLPVGFCHQSWQTTFNAFISILSGYLPGTYSTFNFGSTTPAVEDQDKPWLKTNADGSPNGWKIFHGGEWVMAEELPFPPGFITDYYGLVADIPLLNGGTALNPFWRVCDGTNGTPDMRGRCSIGVGQGAGLTDRVFGATGGAETHILIAAETSLPVHTHLLGVDDGTVENDSENGRLGVDGGHNTYWGGGVATIHTAETRQSEPGAAADPHNNMPPFYALYKIMRTNRLH